MRENKRIILLVAILLIILLGYEFYYKKSDAFGSASISWNQGGEPDLAGYKIYYGILPRTGNCPNDSNYSDNVDVGNVVSYTFDKLENNKTYYFSVSAYDESGNESCFSDEVKKTIL